MLDKGSSSINLKSFHYYDRMYPSQDVASSIGNLIALPLQGQTLKNGNSAFVDKNGNAYPDQWDILLNHTEKLSKEDIEKYMAKWQTELAREKGMLVSSFPRNRPKPWKKKEGFVKSDVVGKMHIVLEDGVYVDTLNLMPNLQNQIRSMEFCQRLIQKMQESGIHVMVKEEVIEHFAIIDDELVWHGGMNLLGKEDAWDNLMRIKSGHVAAELLEIAWKK